MGSTGYRLPGGSGADIRFGRRTHRSPATYHYGGAFRGRAMEDWQIKSIVRGQLEADRSILLTFSGMGNRFWFPSTVYYLTNGEEHVLIDSGYDDPATLGDSQSAFGFDTDASLDELLREHAVPPEDLDRVVLSHLHWDHSGNVGLFDDERTELLVSREAMRYASAPLSYHARSFLSPSAGYEPSWLGSRFTFVDGDATIAPGLRMIRTPGHTPGHRSFLVESGGTIYGLAIDVFPLYENLGDGDPETFHPPGTMDVRAWWDSARRLTEAADVVVPSHDPDGPGTEWIAR